MGHEQIGCQFIRDVQQIKFDSDAGGILHLLLAHPDSANIFHVLWGYVPLFRDAMLYGVLKHFQILNNIGIKNLTLQVALPEKFLWLEMMVKGFPTDDIPVTIYTTQVTSFRAYMDQYKTSSKNCFTFKWRWASFLGMHDSWEANVPGFSAQQMQRWTENLRKVHLIHQNRTQSKIGAAQRHAAKEIEEIKDSCYQERPLALLVERGCSKSPRQLIDLETGHPALVHMLPKVQALGYDAEFISICNSTHQQLTHFSRANVVVSVHGAQLTNIIFMKPCHLKQYPFDGNDVLEPTQSKSGFHPAMIEVSFRFTWCAPRDQKETNGSRAVLLQRWRKCSQKNEKHGAPTGNPFYHKADFFRLATGMDVRYVEVLHDAVVIGPSTRSNPIGVKAVIVNSSLILKELQRVKDDNGYDYRKHPTYNGKEGVYPYRIGNGTLWEHFKRRFKEWAIRNFSL